MGSIFVLLFGCYLIYLDKVNASWGSPDSNQYHIQTDEGPERYFRYQTDNGQFRKEKRLQDGTVIGTDAWIDASGYLRQKDYIADDKGYRILKSKTVYVGRDLPIQDAIKSVKNRPADSGVLVSQGPAYRPSPPPQPVAIVPTTPAPIAPPVTPTGIKAVFVRPHSQPVSTNYLPANIPQEQYLPPRRYYPSSTPRPELFVPSSTPYSPLAGNDLSSTPIAVFAPVSTPSPLADRSEAHLPPLVIYNSDPKRPHEYDHPTPRPDDSIYQLTNDLLPPKPQFVQVIPTPISHRRRIPHDRRRPAFVEPISITSAAPFIERATPAPKPLVVPLSDNGLEPTFNRDLLEPPPSYQQQQQQRYQPSRRADHIYDGVSVTNDGFRYYLPRQYHEENNSGSSTRDGSFGYIDPFGIRRVVYYNTGPGKGFVHRKNNRFVGFNATPYDPRPV